MSSDKELSGICNPSFKLPKAFLSPIILLFFVLLLITGCKKTDDGLKADCNIHAGQCLKQSGNFEVSFDINPKPVKSMADVVFSAGIKEGNNPVKDASVIIDLTMPGMYMGENKIALKHIKDGVYEGKGVIIRCPSGQKLWKAEMIVEKSGQKYSASFLFETVN